MDKKMYKKMDKKMDSGYGGMISEDYSAPANLPREVKQVNYPQKQYVNDKYLNDTITGIDKNSNDSVNKFNKKKTDNMY